MSENSFLSWLSHHTETAWWHDSADPEEIAVGIANGAVGITTNPVLIKQALSSSRRPWASLLAETPKNTDKEAKAEEIIRRITVKIAGMFEPIYRQTAGRQGYVCAQVSPRYPGDRERMIAMAQRLHRWAPNIAVKLPVTSAGLEVLEECAANGITITATVSFTVPQVIAVAERYRRGITRARAAGIKPGPCFAVITVGRVDDYLREVAHDCRAAVEESDLIQAGTALMKRADEIFTQRGYEAVLMPAGMRGDYHAAALAGGRLVMSIHPKIQAMLAKLNGPFTEQIAIPVDPAVIGRLQTIPEFVKAYEPDGMAANEFIAYGAVQKTLSQFVEAGWVNVEEYSF